MHADEEEQEQKLRTSAQPDRKPLIQELDSNDAQSTSAASQKSKKVEPTIPFSWEKAERVELKGNFIS